MLKREVGGVDRSCNLSIASLRTSNREGCILADTSSIPNLLGVKVELQSKLIGHKLLNGLPHTHPCQHPLRVRKNDYPNNHHNRLPFGSAGLIDVDYSQRRLLWLHDRALASEGLSARTYVVCIGEAPGSVVGYYAISTAMAHRSGLPKPNYVAERRMKCPLLLIGRLAVDVTHQKRGSGTVC